MLSSPAKNQTLAFAVTKVLPQALAFALAFSIPFLLSQSQLVTGTLVNTFLFALARKNLKNNWPLLTAPSLGTLARHLLFGPQTIYLAFLLPTIWLGNLLLVLTAQKFCRLPAVLIVTLAATVKAAFLFTATWFVFQAGFIPSLFLSTMGLTQLFTALAGGLAEYFAFKTFSYGKNTP